MKSAQLNALFILDQETFPDIFGPEQRAELEELVTFIGPPQTKRSILADRGLLSEVEVIFSGWGAPLMDPAFLEAAPRLRAVFYAGGSIRYFVTPEFWERGLVLASSASANALPVAEYTLGTILLSLKRFWSFAAAAKQGQGWGSSSRSVPGAFRSIVALISVGMISRRVARLLQPFDLTLLAHCPFISKEEAQEAGLTSTSLLDCFQKADVVSLHTPELPATRGMITGEHFAAMKPDATFINTARGAVVRQSEMIEVLRQRPDLTAVLDVTDPEPTPADSPLLQLPNVIVTPHIAGSLSRECRRMGQYMVDDFKRYLAGQPLLYQVTRESAANQA